MIFFVSVLCVCVCEGQDMKKLYDDVRLQKWINEEMNEGVMRGMMKEEEGCEVDV